MGATPELLARVKSRIGTILNGKWRLERVLGVGGMAAVYMAQHRNQKRVAVKMLHPELAVDEAIRSRFLREGYAANTVDHPGSVTVFDDDTTPDGAAFLVMELLEGETLDARAERKGLQLPLGEVLMLAYQLLDVLRAAHEKGIVHRDIKPENLFLTTSGQLKVLDFGIARLREFSMGKDSTAVGSFMGTPAFMAPEQARGRWEDVDGRSDIWAVGATMFTLLTGRHVHEAETINDQLVLSATARAPSIATVMPELPASVVTLIDRALAFDKMDRWQDAHTMRAELEVALAEVGGPDRLVIPRTSVSRFDEPLLTGETMATPPDIGMLSAKQKLETSATAAVTSSRVSAHTLLRSKRAALLTLGGLVLLGFVVLTAILTRSNAQQADNTPEPAERSVSATQPTGQGVPVVAPPSTAPPAVQPRVEPSEAPSATAVAPATAAPPSRPVSSTVRRVPSLTAKPKPEQPTPAPAVTGAGAASSKPPPSSNPFDRRF